jgi:hypothetical protein
MATNSILVKVIVIYFGINLLLYAGGVRLTDTTVFADLVTTNNANASITDSGLQFGIGAIGDNNPNVNQDSGSTALTFIDVLSSVRTFVNFIAVMFGGVFIVFLLFPPVIQFFLGVPLALLAIIGSIYFARSGQ